MSTDVVVIGVGSNLDSSIVHLRKALAEIKKISGLQVLNVSSVFESDAQLPVDAPTSWNRKFLNAAILVEVEDKAPLQLLADLKNIEILMGRKSAETWAPRIIDLDILYWDQLQVSDVDLHIPHPQLAVRPFALLPLLQILPQANVARPFWTNQWVTEKPFSTIKSKSYFWPQFIGIVNLTEDSFSDGGLYLDEDRLHLQIQKLLASKADILDFGAQSTRPQATPVDAETELKRLQKGFKLLQSVKGTYQVSLDCTKPEVIGPCLQDYEINFINDVTGLRNPKIVDLAIALKKKVFVMHSLSVPAILEEVIPEQNNPIDFLKSWWFDKKTELLHLGLQNDQLIFDPGIGFGKTKQQNLYILKNLDQFQSVQEEILIGHSRKSYQTLFSTRAAADRDLETALTTSGLNMAFTQYLRVHDIPTQAVGLRWK